MSKKPKEEASELEYLKWFRINADFGPADGDVQYIMDRNFERETGKKVPKGWRSAGGDDWPMSKEFSLYEVSGGKSLIIKGGPESF